jgi:hypothetical protein
MTPTEQIDYILGDCLLAVGQAIRTEKTIDAEAISWWRQRYRVAFLHAMVGNGNSWERDRHRVTAVGRYLGERALFHAEGKASIDLHSARQASADVEAGCRMNAFREGVDTARYTPGPSRQAGQMPVNTHH